MVCYNTLFEPNLPLTTTKTDAHNLFERTVDFCYLNVEMKHK
jgi:hypothetical protein